MTDLAYLTDVEGQWSKIEDFARDNPLVSLDRGGRITVRGDGIFVFGGDAIDRGPDGRRVVTALLEAKRRQPDRVVLLAGNRDINKMRLVRELGGSPPLRAPAELVAAGPGAILKWIFTHTMGAREAFEHRRTELAASGEPTDDDDVAASYLRDLGEGGPLRDYLGECRLAFRSGTTLFVHGGVTPENFGVVPGHADRAPDVDAWIARLDAFHQGAIDAFRKNSADDAGYRALIAYQAPLAGSRVNQTSVVYARPDDLDGAPLLPPEVVVHSLRESGITRVISGHTPSGDCPSILRDDDDFTLVLADNSYGRVEVGSMILIAPSEIRVRGAAILDGGERVVIDCAIRDGDGSPIGKLDRASGRLVKARLARGDYLLYRALADRRVEQIAIAAGDLDRSSLVAPKR